MEPTNGRRVVRALEVVLLTGAMPGELTAYEHHYETTYLGLDRPDLAARTDLRVDRMWAHGLVDEVRRLEQRGLREGVTASRALGYAQVLAMLDGRYDEPAAIETTKTATRRFVRRQRAWFRRDPRIRWLDPDTDLREQGMAALASK
jgi:tRNA dimethylallyltransferase